VVVEEEKDSRSMLCGRNVEGKDRTMLSLEESRVKTSDNGDIDRRSGLYSDLHHLTWRAVVREP